MAHPEPDELLAFVEGDLGAPRRAEIEGHLDRCDACRETVGGLARAFLSSALEATSDPEPFEMVGLPEIGSKLGRFHLLEELGRGAMGAVFAAYDPDLDRRVALKVLLRGSDPGDRGQSRLLREAQAMARLSHPNVITVHEAQVVEGRLYISMEYVGGGTLRAWLDEGPHPWPEVLDVFVAVGRGLEAAHRAGIVHRDVKPENVLMGGRGADRHVRVTDFGLARATEVETRDDDAAEAALEPTRVDMTAAGALVGTPAYMSPEQFRGERAGPRSDQFSFCVALYEGLYGRRPFEGGSLTVLAAAVISGDRREPPGDRNVPRWLRQAVFRGLRREPELRFESMTELLRELDRPQSKGAVSPAVVAGGVAVLGIGITAGSWVALRDPACSGAEVRLVGVWDGPTKTRVREAILASEVPYATVTWEGVAHRVDDYAENWARAYVDACEATVVRKVQSEQALDARMRCLERRRERLSALVEVLRTSDPAVAENAVAAVDGLPPIVSCADPELVVRALPPPDDPNVVAAVDEGRRALARVQGLTAAGRYEDAVTLGREVLTTADALDHDPFIAEVDLALGRALLEAGEYDEAVAKLDHAVWVGRASGHDEVVLDGSIALVLAHQQRSGTTSEALSWARRAWAEVERNGDEPRTRAALMVAEANARREAGDFGKARGLIESAVALRREFFGDEHPETARALADLGKVLEAVGDFDAALAVNEEALAMFEHALGPDHPSVAYALMSLAYVHGESGRDDEALRLEERALAIFESSLRANHPRIATTRSNMASTLAMLGRVEEAIAMAERSIAMYEAERGTEHADLVAPLLVQAQALMFLERNDEALTRVERAVRILEVVEADKPNPLRLAQAHMVRSNIAIGSGRIDDAFASGREFIRLTALHTGEESDETAQAHLNLGSIAGIALRFEDAVTHLETALRILEAAHGAEHPFVALAVNNLSAAYRQTGRYDEAIAFAERAIELRRARADTTLGSVGQGYFNLGAALRVSGRRREAIENYELALSHYRRGGIEDPVDIADAEFELGQLLWSAEPRRAVALLRSARERYATSTRADARRLVDEIDAKLRR